MSRKLVRVFLVGSNVMSGGVDTFLNVPGEYFPTVESAQEWIRNNPGDWSVRESAVVEYTLSDWEDRGFQELPRVESES